MTTNAFWLMEEQRWLDASMPAMIRGAVKLAVDERKQVDQSRLHWLELVSGSEPSAMGRAPSLKWDAEFQSVRRQSAKMFRRLRRINGPMARLLWKREKAAIDRAANSLWGIPE